MRLFVKVIAAIGHIRCRNSERNSNELLAFSFLELRTFSAGKERDTCTLHSGEKRTVLRPNVFSSQLRSMSTIILLFERRRDTFYKCSV